MKRIKLFLSIFITILLLNTGCETREEAVQPTACFSFAPMSNIKAGDEVSFTNCSTDANSYEWDFGDDGTSMGENPKHTFDEGGEYDVTLIVSNEKNLKDEVVHKVVVESGIEACFTMSPNPAQLNENVTFSNCSEGADRYEWDFNSNGTIDSELKNPVFYFTAVKTFNVTLKAWHGDDYDEVMHQLIIEDGGTTDVEACFTMSPNPAQLNENVTFSNCSEGADRYEWDFNSDGTVDSELETPVFYFTAVGTFNVTLKAWSGDDYDEVTHQLIIQDGGSAIDPTVYELNGVNWTTHYYNDFTESGDWYEGSGDDYELKIEGGYYTMIDNNDSEDHYGYYITTTAIQLPSSENYDYEVKIRNTEDNNHNGSGVVFGRKYNEPKYDFFKFKNGYYGIGDTDEAWTPSWVFASNGNIENWNLLTVRRYENMFYFFLNKEFLYSHDYSVFGNYFGFTFDKDTKVDIDKVGIFIMDGSKAAFKAANDKQHNNTPRTKSSGRIELLEKI